MTSANRFPWWVVCGGFVIALAYLPTLAAPFDFIDDGNLVYPVGEQSLRGQFDFWWQRVADNVDHLGPFRPVVHAHWQVQANLFHADPLVWRSYRLVWCALAAMGMLWLMRELRLHPVAALVATAAAFWNPYRNEIWTSLTLAEGVAMPYAMLALVAARKATQSARPWRWDAAAVFGVLMCLGCKNTFVALVPAMMWLRVSRDTTGSAGRPWLRAGVYLLPVLVPAIHFVYFKMNWKPGQYETHGPTWTQTAQFWLAIKGAAGLDFLAAGIVLAAGWVWYCWPPSPSAGEGLGVRGNLETPTPSPLTPLSRGEGGTSGSILPALLLLAFGFGVYLPMDRMSPRYTIPAIWGFDLLFAALLTRLVPLPDVWPKRAVWAGVGVGVLAVLVAGIGRQEKLSARHRLLWEVVEHIERTALQNEAIGWVSGNSEIGELNAEEGIHVAWHLKHRGRGDVRIGLYDATGAAITRVELPPLDAAPHRRIIAGAASDPTKWSVERPFTQTYRLGRKRYECRIETANVTATAASVSHVPRMPSELPASGQGFMLDRFTAKYMQEAFGNPGKESETLMKLLPKVPNGGGAAEVLIRPEVVMPDSIPPLPPDGSRKPSLPR